MSEVNGMVREVVGSPSPPRCVCSRERPRSRSSLLSWAWWTAPLHVFFGIGFWWMMQWDPYRLGPLVIGVHVLFPLVLLITIRWWWNRWGELLALLLINHATTFGVLLCLPW